MVDFIPDMPKAPVMDVPFFEDSQKGGIPGRATEKSVVRLQQEIRDLISQLGGGVVSFTSGTYPGKPPRYGFEITFKMDGTPARMRVAALPLRSETAHKKDRALAQALYLLRNWLESEVHSSVYRPGSYPLMPYLIGASGRTVTEELVERGMLPALPMWT